MSHFARIRVGAAAAGTASACLALSRLSLCDKIPTVEIQERSADKWSESSQRKLADSLIDWGDLDYANSLRCIRQAYAMPVDKMRSISDHFIAEAQKGLAGKPSSMLMLPSYVTQRVTGSERGDFYALDLGGTNFRVLCLTLLGEGKVGPIKQGRFKIPDAMKTGSGEELFGFLADSVATFLATECGGNPTGNMGFTFSFPVQQSAINAGVLVTWSKEFACSGVVGTDVVDQLQNQLVSRGINLKVSALANDTVGTMEAAAYRRPNTVMGVILGTGTNAAYIAKLASVSKWKGASSDEMVINTEWGNLDMASYMNKYDCIIDAKSSNPSKQTFEKMISGMYLGELVRVTMMDPAVQRGLSAECRDAMNSKLSDTFSFETAKMSVVESDTTPDLKHTEKLLKDVGIHTTLRDRALLRDACVSVSTRAAKLSATGVASLLNLVGNAVGGVIAIDGTVFEMYPFFKERMEYGLEQLLGVDQAKSTELILAKDGSGVGAAIIAAIGNE